MHDPSSNAPIDDRIGFGLFARVAKVLEDHGYEQPDDASHRARATAAFLKHLELATLAYEGVDVDGVAESVPSAPPLVITNSADVPVAVRLEDGSVGYLLTATDLDRVINKLSAKGRD